MNCSNVIHLILCVCMTPRKVVQINYSIKLFKLYLLDNALLFLRYSIQLQLHVHMRMLLELAPRACLVTRFRQSSSNKLRLCYRTAAKWMGKKNYSGLLSFFTSFRATLNEENRARKRASFHSHMRLSNNAISLKLLIFFRYGL